VILIKKGKGFTLIELLIAIFLSAILFSISAGVIINSTQLNRLAQQQMRMEDSANVAKYFIERDIRRSGYYSTLNDKSLLKGTLAIKNFSKECHSDDEKFPLMLYPFVFGLNNSAKGYHCISDYVADSDVLTLRYIRPVTEVKTNKTARHKVYMRLSSNQVRMFKAKDSNYYKNTIAGVSELFEVKAHIYYLRKTNRKCDGQDVFGLYREYNTDQGFMKAEEIVSGVEQLQIRYLVNDSLVNADVLTSGDDWKLVQGISVTLLLRSHCKEGSAKTKPSFQLEDMVFTPKYNLGFQRQIYQFYVGLRNSYAN